MTNSGLRNRFGKNGSAEKPLSLNGTITNSTDKGISEPAMRVRTRIILYLIKTVVYAYDILTWPIYFLLHQPWNKWKDDKIIWAKQIQENDPYSPCVRVAECHLKPLNDVNTMDELFRNVVKQYGTRRCVGVREVLAETYENKNGKDFKKVQLGEYKWYSYLEFEERVENFTRSLLELGLKPKKQIAIFAETRIEWMLICQACFRINIPVATMYATLGEEGIVHGINETEITHIFTSQDLLPKLKKILGKTPAVTTIVFMENINPVDTFEFSNKISVIPFSQLEKMGRTSYPNWKPQPPDPDDLAIIMYTSGSTGIPKGVLLTHKNLVTAVFGFRNSIPILNTSDIYIAYLPLAHVLEIAAECFCLTMGTRVGYSSPYTLTDKSPAIIPGCKGDASVLKPSIMCAVPLMLDKIRKGVNEIVNSKGDLGKEIFNFAFQYKYTLQQWGYSTPILNRLVFKKIKKLLGGNVRLIACGGAPLSSDTQDFIRVCFDVYMVQAYGTTESAACAAIMSVNDYSTGRVGGPQKKCYIRLVDWPEGNYYATDKPYPRGELVVGGDCVAKGYFKNDVLTRECFLEEDGIRWFYTGDIGELHPNGTLRVIDRKKDLVKLMQGEYISLGKVEAELKTCPFIDNICVVGNSLQDHLVALIVPNVEQLKNLAVKMEKSHLPFELLCQDASVIAAVTKAITEHGQKSKLAKMEIPTKVKLCTEDWQPETGLVTAAFKIRRKIIEHFYQDSIKEMYNTHINGQLKLK